MKRERNIPQTKLLLANPVSMRVNIRWMYLHTIRLLCLHIMWLSRVEK